MLAGLPGSQINAEKDLGVTDTHFPALQLILKPAKKHKFRLNFVPISFTGDAVLKQNIDFNGIRYQVGVPVNSTMTWDAWRFGYEYDFVSSSFGLRRLHRRGEIHQRENRTRQPVRVGVRGGEGADSGDRRHRPDLRRAVHLDHR